MDLLSIPVFKFSSHKNTIISDYFNKVIEIDNPKGLYDINSEQKILQEFINTNYEIGIIANCEVNLVDNLKQKINSVEKFLKKEGRFDCVFLAASFSRSFYNDRLFVDKNHLNNFQQNYFLRNVLISSSKAVYLITRSCALKVLKNINVESGLNINSILNRLTLDRKIENLFCKDPIEYNKFQIRLDYNQCGLFSTFSTRTDQFEDIIEKNNTNWIEFEGSDVINYFSSKLSDDLYFNTRTSIPSNGIYHAYNGKISSSGIIYTQNNKPIYELSLYGPINLRTQRDSYSIINSLKEVKEKQTQKINGTCLHLTSNFDHIYGHAILGCMPKSKIFKELNLNYKFKYDYVILPKNFKYNNLIVKYLNIEENKILHINDQKLYQFDLVISPTPRSPNRLYRKNNFDFVKEIFELNNDKQPFRKIYIPRLSFTRSPENELEIISLFKSYGFEIIFPEKDKRYLPRIFSEAKIIAGPHGSNLSDACFCQKNSCLIDILSPFHVYQYYSSLCEANNMEYYSVLGERIGSIDDLKYRININKLKSLLNAIL